MDYILRSLDRKIKFYEASNKSVEQKVYLQARFEYVLVYVLGYLWNKNLSVIDEDTKEHIFSIINKPSIGSIVEIARALDHEREIFKSKLFNRSINKYPAIRNEKIGHGYTFEDGSSDINLILKDLYNTLFKAEVGIINQKIDLILVEKLDNKVYKGIRFNNNGSDYLPWNAHFQSGKFEIGSIYGLEGQSNYFRLSPFIQIENENDFSIFASVEENLTGRVKYNRLFTTGIIFKDWDELCNLNIAIDMQKRKSRNGTVLNIFDNNFIKYIDVGIKRDLENFLNTNRSSVYATIWGHGGVGKTAAIQSYCEDLSNKNTRDFDYIIFMSAKDRSYDYFKGKIVKLDQKENSLDSIIQKINTILFANDSFNSEDIIQFKGKVLIIIDDFETFSESEQKKIAAFLNKLNINHHKVILTTRAANLIRGIEIKIKEFTNEQTTQFLLQIIGSQFPELNIIDIETEITQTKCQPQIFNITGGRPLFIFQLAVLISQRAIVKDVLHFDIKSTESATDFLFGRIYDYLSFTAKDLFVTMSLITSETDLSSLLNRLRFILNLEKEEDKFSAAINELTKLKIIETIDADFFRIYSIEIWHKMKEYLQKRDNNFQTEISQRLEKINTYKDLDTELALIKHADNSRISQEVEKVEANYREIIIRETNTDEIKLTALFHLAHYYYSDLGYKIKAVKLFEEFEQKFEHSGEFISRFAFYYFSSNIREQRLKAIKMLQRFVKQNESVRNEMSIEILGQLVQYQCMVVISDREELKIRKGLGEVQTRDFDAEWKKQYETMKTILNHNGQQLFSILKNQNSASLSSKVRQQLLNGLVQFCEICIRLNKFEKAQELCDFTIDNFPSTQINPFKAKIEKIKKYTIKMSYNANNLTKHQGFQKKS